MYLHVLDRSPHESAKYLADLHLGPSITTYAKLFSTAVIETSKDIELVRIKNLDVAGNVIGVRIEYRLGKHVLMPPVNDPGFRPWIDWIKAEYQRAWWVVATCWGLDTERRHRFGETLNHHSDHARMNLWAQGQVCDVFPRKGLPIASSLPIVIPGKDLSDVDPIEAYRSNYACLGGKMRWTKRSKPEWLGGPVTKKSSVQSSGPAVCSTCGSDAGGELCGLTNCPLQEGQLLP